MRAALVDTGAFVALFDDADNQFEHYQTLFTALLEEKVRLFSTCPCITEASYLLAPANHLVMLEWLESGVVQLQGFEITDIKEMRAWMLKYSEKGKRRMDFADASLYWLAVKVNTSIVLTVDQKDFSRYKLPNGKSFEIL